ncbi:MAG TPA: diacylglycerol kinase family lipid kinase [Blastocatellia bacterium]|nr:diacylglycerol kinase family lipid kinase [Blastocatellia bacterium]
MSRRTAALIFNPRAGSHRRRDFATEVETVACALSRAGIDAIQSPTSGPNSATDLARRHVADGVDIVIAAGGDGTLNEVLQGMAGSATPLAIWPAGTANVLARELGLSTEIDDVVETVAHGRPLRIAIGKAGDRYFFLMAGIGLDAAIIRDVRAGLKATLGEGAFWLVGLAKFFSAAPEPFVVDIDGTQYDAGFVAIGNASRYGGSLSLTPDARIDEPVLDVCIFPPKTLAISYVPNLIACMTGDPTRFGDVTYLKTDALRASSADGERPWVQVDGEVIGQLPMEFRSVPDALTVMIPAAANCPVSVESKE